VGEDQKKVRNLWKFLVKFHSLVKFGEIEAGKKNQELRIRTMGNLPLCKSETTIRRVKKLSQSVGGKRNKSIEGRKGKKGRRKCYLGETNNDTR